jgi:hypothetical protein
MDAISKKFLEKVHTRAERRAATHFQGENDAARAQEVEAKFSAVRNDDCIQDDEAEAFMRNIVSNLC